MTPTELVQKMDEALLGWAYKDIFEINKDTQAKMACFILGSCFIDAVAGFHAGLTRQEVRRGGKSRFVKFVKDYLTKYNAEKLYTDLRCYLVHSYTEGGTYIFTHQEKAGKHFDTVSGKTLLNLEDFIEEIREAYNSFRQDILSSDAAFVRAIKRYRSLGLLGIMTVKNEKI